MRREAEHDSESTGNTRMRCPGLSDLPPPPPGTRGWPWTTESREPPALGRQGAAWPRISVVTPSLDQGRFIEATIRSVLLQGYPDLEYFVLDGGSTDETRGVIERYAPWLAAWASGRDAGQSDAINRGLRQASGEFACWINSDDLLCRNALARHAVEVGFAPGVVYVGRCIRIDEHGRYLFTHQGSVRSLEDLLRLERCWRAGRHIVQPEVLFPRRLALAVGGLDVHNHRTMDYDLWGRFLLAGARLEYTPIPFGMSRRHAGQKTRDRVRQTESLAATARMLLSLAPDFSDRARSELLTEIDGYLDAFRRSPVERPGRLEWLGLPSVLVRPLRALRRWLGARLSDSF
jgi:glycosyltransferase involved in cell wall biosynthesis